MKARSSTFSDHWHRVAGLRLALRPTLRIHRQSFRGETWYVVRDPMNDSFFRLRPQGYAFAARLSPERTVEKVWEELLEAAPENALGQEDVIHLLTQLHHANLLYVRGSADAGRIFERVERKRVQQLQNRLMNFMYPHFPLVDPDRFLNAISPLIRFLCGPVGMVLWVAVMGLGVKTVIDHASELSAQTEGVLAPSNWWALFLGMVLLKSVHEFGHAAACKLYGGEVHTMGVAMLIFTPMPFVDATSSWGFQSRWKRAIVGAAGMIAELPMAALAALFWAHSASGLAHSVSFNMMWIASVTSLLFNMNPLVRFDGYYIISDLLDIPNLSQRATQMVTYLAEKYLLGGQAGVSPANSRSEAVYLTVYAVLSGAYKLFMSCSIMLYVGTKYLILGMFIAASAFVTWAIVPAVKLLKYLAVSPSLSRSRPRAIAVCLLWALVLGGLLGAVPLPRRFRAPGVVEAVHFAQVSPETPGKLVKFLVKSGSRVTSGMALAELENPTLDLDLRLARSQLDEIAATEQKATTQALADLEPLKQRRRAVESVVANLEAQKAALTVRARQDGVWQAPRGTALEGSWVQRGDSLGSLVDPGEWRFTAVVSQEEASELFVDKIGRVELRLFAQDTESVDVKSYKIIPYQQRDLPSAALGMLGGGDIQVANNDKTGVKSTEPFFQIEAALAGSSEVLFLHGRSGQLRLTLAPEPLLMQVGRKLRQLVQKRYKT